MSQATLGLINGALYAMLSLGLAVIFGMLNIVNFASRRALYGGRVRDLGTAGTNGISYWAALVIAPRSWSARSAFYFEKHADQPVA